MNYRESTPLAASPSELGPGDGIRRARRAIKNKLKKCGKNSRCGSPSGVGARIKAAVSGGSGNRKPMRNKNVGRRTRGF
tara:strand:+ start:2500 stop:2736 length:237 start_codon:yes stop_codon:yes gene_type:complete